MSQRTTRRSLLSALFALALVGAVTLWIAAPPGRSALASSDPGNDLAPAGLGFGQRIAGTWVEPGNGYSLIMNIRADGTLTWWGSWFFGDGGDYFNGVVLGTWKRTGPREITTIEAGHINDGDGTFTATGRLQEVFTFDEDFDSFMYDGFEDLFAPDQDPTDPDAVPFDSFGFAGGPIKRLSHMN